MPARAQRIGWTKKILESYAAPTWWVGLKLSPYEARPAATGDATRDTMAEPGVVQRRRLALNKTCRAFRSQVALASILEDTPEIVPFLGEGFGGGVF